MDHLGVEAEATDEVTAATTRLAAEGLATAPEDNTTCCYAVQDKVWVTGPGDEPGRTNLVWCLTRCMAASPAPGRTHYPHRQAA
jgi:hypothetical protein